MSAAAEDFNPDTDSFIVCFYCCETFHSLQSLVEHCCSKEGNDILDLEPLETFSNISSADLGQNEFFDSSESVLESPSDISRLVIVETEAESTASSVCGTSLSEIVRESKKPEPGIQLNAKRQEITELASDVLKKQLSEANSDGAREVSKLSSDASEKRLVESNSDVVSEEITKLTSDACKEQLAEANAGTEQKITQVRPNANDNLNMHSPDLVSKVLQCYETKQGTPNASCKLPSTEEGFQSSHSQLPVVESGSPKHDDIQMECSANEVCKESDALKHDARGLASPASNMCSGPSSSKMESDSSNMFSRSSSIETGLDSIGYSDDQADSYDSDDHDIISPSEKKSDVLKHDYEQVKSHASEISGKSLSEENINITKHDSVIVKPCYVKVHDIFKSLPNTKVSPEKIFSWKKKYHVCDVCNKFFRLRSDLNIHYLIHTVVKPYVCNICEKSFIKQCNLFAHHRTHVTKMKHVCPVCKKKFPKKSVLLKHKLTHTMKKPFSCDKCGKSYSVKSSLNEHYLTHSNERPFVCEICSASFGNKRYLRKHYHTHQNMGNACEFCFKTFKRRCHLEEHYNIHTNDKPYECKFCSKSFHLLLTLNSHYSKVHINERALVSPESVKTFADYSIGKFPVIEKLAVVDKCEKAPVVQKIEKSVVRTSKDAASYSTRRKSFTPKKYMQPQ